MLINGHAHVFNLQAVLTDHAVGIIRDRVRRELSPKALADAVADEVGSLFEDVQNGTNIDEGRFVRDVLEKLTGSVGFDDLRDALPKAIQKIVDKGVSRLENALLFRLVDSLDRVLNQRKGDARSATLTDAIALLRLALQTSTRDVAIRLMHELGPDRGVVLLMMDITNGAGSDDQLFTAQVDDLSNLVLAYPGRVFPFFAVHTRRPDHFTRMQNALNNQGFVGVKLYPALGTDVTTDQAKAVLREAARLDVPVLSHTTPNGFFESDGSIDLGDPVHWRELLQEIDGFRVCLAHFGGSSNLATSPIPSVNVVDPRRRWTSRILQLIRGAHGDRVFTDVSYHEAPMEGDDNERIYFPNLKSLLAEAGTRDQVLFGTDSWVVRTRLSEGSYWRFFQEGVATNGLTSAEFKRLSETNNHRFLGLPLASPSLPTRPNIERYVRFVHRNLDSLESKPAPWLLEALRQQHGDAVVTELESREWPLADSLAAPNWKELIEGTVQGVLDTTVSGVAGEKVEIADVSFGFEAAPLGFQGDGELSLTVFNRVDQFQSLVNGDPDGVLAPAGADGPDDPFGPFPQPPVVFDPQRAWLKYRAEGHLAVKASTGLGLSGVGLEATAEKSIVMADYRRHERTERLRDVVPSDLGWPRYALEVEDVLRLKPGDAVLFQAHGRLAARVTVKWADVFTFGLSRLARLLKSPKPLGVQADIGASVAAVVTFEDDFRVVFARTGQSRRSWRVEVRKVETRGRGVAVSVGATVRFENPDAVKSLLGQHLGAGLGRVEALLRQNSVNALGPMQKRLFEAVSEKLGVSTLEGLEEKLGELKKSLAEAIDEIVREKLEIGFSYEYSRIETDSALLVADLDARAVEALHGQLVRGNFTPALDWAADNEEDPAVAGSLKILRYVLTEEDLTRRAWGFSLSFGRWLKLAQRNETELLVRRQRSRLDSGAVAERFAYVGSRSQTDQWMGREWKWEVDLDARMDRVSNHSEPMTSDFTYNLGFDFSWNTGELRQRFLDPILDAAALWGVLPIEEDGLVALRARFGEVLDSQGLGIEDLLGKKVECHLQLLFDQVALARILPRAKRDNSETRERMATAMAAAMPFRANDELRGNLSERRRVYERLFSNYLRDSREGGFVLERSLTDYKADARARLRALGHSAAARREDEAQTFERMWTFAGMLNKNQRTAQSWHRCLEGLGGLAAGVGRISGTKHTAIKGQFKDMAGFWKLTHHVRSLVAYLLAVATVQGMPEGVMSTITIEFEREGRQVVISVGPATE